MAEWIELPLHWWDVTIRLVLALAFGAAVGLEREFKGQDAGLRTHMLIALGAAVFAMIGVMLYEIVAKEAMAQGVSPPGDPLRTISGVVAGIGFLGAGAIMRHNGQIEGLTTAAGIWTVASVGIAAGLGFMSLALIVTVLVFITLYLVRLVERPLKS